MRPALVPTLLVLCALIPLGVAAQAGNPSGPAEFLEAREVFGVEAVDVAGDAVRIRAVVAPGHYVYRHRLRVDVNGTALPLMLPQGQTKTDEFFGTTEVYRGVVEFEARGARASGATLHWQGCADAGICYPPQVLRLTLPGAEPTASTADRAPVASGGSALAEDEALARRLAGGGIAVAVAVFFGLGVLLAFTPCTLPMVPIVSTVVLGGRPAPRRALALSFAYVLPMALAYAGLGVAAGLSGANLQAALQQPWLLGSFAVLFVVLAFAMFGAFELQPPAWLRNRLDRAGRAQAGGTFAGAAAMGVLSALLVGPCMTAPLAGALLYIGQSGDPVTGGAALFALGLGMGLPLLLIAGFGARVLPKPGPWMTRVKAGFGLVLLALAVATAGRALPAPVGVALWGAWLLTVAAGLMALASPSGAGPLQRWAPRGIAAIVSVWALAMMLGGAAGATDPLRPLATLARGADPEAARGPTAGFVPVESADDVARLVAEARERGQWTLVDVYADWCVSCHVIEREVFGDPRVAAVLARMQVLRPDVTANDATDRALLDAWQVAGPPTLLLIGPDGRERRELRTVGEVDAETFLGRLRAAGAGAA